MNKKLGFWVLIGCIIVIVSFILYGIIGLTVRKPDEIISKNTEHIYVKRYGFYNNDTTMLMFKNDKYYDGIVINKKRRSSYVGVPGKGGHPSVRYYIEVQFNDTTQEFRCRRLYDKYNEGDIVTIKESFYPTHNIEVL